MFKFYLSIAQVHVVDQSSANRKSSVYLAQLYIQFIIYE